MLERMKSIVGSFGGKAFNCAMAKIQPEYVGINALAKSLALLVMADGVVEDQELEDVSEFLVDLDIVIEKNLIREVSEFFLEAVEQLQAGFYEGKVQGNIVVGEILADIASVKDDKHWRESIESTVNLVTSGVGVDPKEQKTRDRILKALRGKH